MRVPWPAVGLCFACATAPDPAPPPACQWGGLQPTEWDLAEEQELCAQQGAFVDEANWCADGRIEYHCGADSYSFQGCFDADGTRIGWFGYDRSGEGDPVVWGTGTWCDCDGDGWPPSLEEYCELRGEAPPPADG